MRLVSLLLAASLFAAPLRAESIAVPIGIYSATAAADLWSQSYAERRARDRGAMALELNPLMRGDNTRYVTKALQVGFLTLVDRQVEPKDRKWVRIAVVGIFGVIVPAINVYRADHPRRVR